jgi:hypothetical protein
MSEAIDKPAEVDPTVYRLRANAFVNPRLYRLIEDALTWEEEGKPLDGVFYDDIAEIRLAFAPTRLATNRYRAQVIFRQGGMAELFNTDYPGSAISPSRTGLYRLPRSFWRRRRQQTGDIPQSNSTLGYALNLLWSSSLR